jgi:hypothetical protein
MRPSAGHDELLAMRKMIEYALQDAAALRPVPRGVLAALTIALEELRIEMRARRQTGTGEDAHSP